MKKETGNMKKIEIKHIINSIVHHVAGRYCSVEYKLKDMRPRYTLINKNNTDDLLRDLTESISSELTKIIRAHKGKKVKIKIYEK